MISILWTVIIMLTLKISNAHSQLYFASPGVVVSHVMNLQKVLNVWGGGEHAKCNQFDWIPSIKR